MAERCRHLNDRGRCVLASTLVKVTRDANGKLDIQGAPPFYAGNALLNTITGEMIFPCNVAQHPDLQSICSHYSPVEPKSTSK